MKYKETFVIPGISTLGISDCSKEPWFEEKKGFKTWSGGCGIHTAFKTIEEARKFIHYFSISRINEDITSLEKQLSILKKSKEQLGNDVFNLGKFLVNLIDCH